MTDDDRRRIIEEARANVANVVERLEPLEPIAEGDDPLLRHARRRAEGERKTEQRRGTSAVSAEVVPSSSRLTDTELAPTAPSAACRHHRPAALAAAGQLRPFASRSSLCLSRGFDREEFLPENNIMIF
jgi:hypothetical protein